MSRGQSETVDVEPLLRWAGSKRSLVRYLLARRPRQFTTYYEPFAGSACLYFALAPERAVLSDRNRELMAMYRTLRARPAAVAAQVRAWETDQTTYYRLRSTTPSTLNAVGRAARFIYLNRLCFNGVYRTNRQGGFNVPYGRHTGRMPTELRFRACAQSLRRATLRDCDFERAIEDAGPGDFVYLDPPYSRAARDAYGVYGYGGFDAEQMTRFRRSLERLNDVGASVMVSYRDSEDLADLGPDWRQDRVEVGVQVGGIASSRSTRRELLLTNYEWPTVATH